MPTRWNTGHSPVVLDWQLPAVMPGESCEFTDDQIAAGLAGDWSDTDPRPGRDVEKTFKKRRDAATTTNDTPAEPEKE